MLGDVCFESSIAKPLPRLLQVLHEDHLVVKTAECDLGLVHYRTTRNWSHQEFACLILGSPAFLLNLAEATGAWSFADVVLCFSLDDPNVG